MKTIGKVWWIFGIFLLLRLVFIFTFPQFVDESIYIKPDLFMPGRDLDFLAVSFWGKLPLAMYLFWWGSKLTSNPLIGARLVTLFFAIAGFFLLFFLLKNLKDEKTSKLGLILFSLCPLFIFFQSMVLMDSLLLTMILAILFLIFEIEKKPKLWLFVLLGVVMGISLWLKVNVIAPVFLGWLALIYLLRDRIGKSLNIFLIFIPILVSVFMVVPLLLRPDFGSLFIEAGRLSLSFSELIRFPFKEWILNFVYFGETLFVYLTPSVFAIFFFIFRGKERGEKFFKVLLFLFIIFSLSIIIPAKIIRTRYFVFALAPALPLLAIGASNFLEFGRKYRKLLEVFLFLPLIFASFVIVAYPASFFSLFPKSGLVSRERDYALSWPSGYGMREAGDYVKTLAKPFGPPVVLALPATPASNLSFYLVIHRELTRSLNIVLVPISSKKEFEALLPFAASNELYFMADSAIIPDELQGNLKLLKSFEKPGKEDYIGLYKVLF